MTYRLGTANFVSKASAIKYYQPYHGDGTIAYVDGALADGSIKLGPPFDQLKPGDWFEIGKGDEDTRYFIHTEKL